jgi:endogenous inhibitor of DNA gyrase (YacG/DUF329 family)
MGEDMPYGPCPECGKPIQMYGNMDNPGKTGAGYECPDLDCPHPPDVKYESDDPVQPDKMPPYDKKASFDRAFQAGWAVAKGRTCPRCNQMDLKWFSGKNRKAAVARGEIPSASESWDHDQKGRFHCERCGFEPRGA